MTNKINIDIVSDVSCPWCVIGYRAFAAAIEKLDFSDIVELNWLPFELNPEMGPDGQNRNDYIREKYGLSAEQAKGNRDNIVNRGLELGYEFKFSEDGRVYNTFNAHRLIFWAKTEGLQTALKLELFDLFFQQQGDPSNTDDLLACVEKAGLDRLRAKEILDSDEYVDQVAKGLDFAFENGISGVPAFIFDNKYLISGGQPIEMFESALQEMVATQTRENS